MHFRLPTNDLFLDTRFLNRILFVLKFFNMKVFTRLLLCANIGIIALSFACTPKPPNTATVTQAQLISTLGQLETELRAGKGTALDTNKINTFVQNAEALATRFPQDSLAPLYLFRAAELRHATGKWEEAIDLWGKIDAKFKNYQRSPEALFMQGFVAENELHDRKQAVKYYQIFIEKYPQHPLSKDASALIDNLKKGVSDQELIEQFEQQQQ